MDDIIILGIFLTLANVAYSLASFFGFNKEQQGAKSVAHVRAKTLQARLFFFLPEAPIVTLLSPADRQHTHRARRAFSGWAMQCTSSLSRLRR